MSDVMLNIKLKYRAKKILTREIPTTSINGKTFYTSIVT